jgi:hypothetical protein
VQELTLRGCGALENAIEGRTLLEVLLGRGDHLEGDDLETSQLKARDNGPNKVTLDAIGLDHDIGALVVGHGLGERTRARRKDKIVVSTSLIV